MFYIDYGVLGKKEQGQVYAEFIEACITRVRVVSALVFLGESIKVIIDFIPGLFSRSSANRLNLIGEVVIILASLITNLFCNKLEQDECASQKDGINLLRFYKITLLIGMCLFITTDIMIRQKIIGTYFVFLFVLQVLPFFDAMKNIEIYIFYSIYIIVFYIKFGTMVNLASLFSSLSIIFAFAFSTECLRSYSVRKIINNLTSKLMTERFSNLARQTITALANAVEAKDMYTKGHSQRVATYSKELARRMGYSEEKLEEVYYIGLLHDIGKLGVGDSVINKMGRLSEEEFVEIEKHPEIGYDILRCITEIPDISIGAKYHHERMDGSGYPNGLKGSEIPQIAQIIAVADAYDAMTSNRSYRQALPQDKARSEIEKNSGIQFSPEIAKLMLQMIDEDVNYSMHA